VPGRECEKKVRQTKTKHVLRFSKKFFNAEFYEGRETRKYFFLTDKKAQKGFGLGGLFYPVINLYFSFWPKLLANEMAGYFFSLVVLLTHFCAPNEIPRKNTRK